jgi:hypothetical protein
MAFTENLEWFIGIEDEGLIQLRRTRVIMDETGEIARRHHRMLLEPGQDISTLPLKVRQVAQVIWTPAVITAWQAKKAALAATRL